MGDRMVRTLVHLGFPRRAQVPPRPRIRSGRRSTERTDSLRPVPEHRAAVCGSGRSRYVRSADRNTAARGNLCTSHPITASEVRRRAARRATGLRGRRRR